MSSLTNQLYGFWHIIDTINNYIFSCSLFSNQGVNLTIYDTDSMISLANPYNSHLNQSCDPNTGCQSNLYVYFQWTNNTYDNMKSVTCAASSTNNQTLLPSPISIGVYVLPSGKSLKLKFFLIEFN